MAPVLGTSPMSYHHAEVSVDCTLRDSVPPCLPAVASASPIEETRQSLLSVSEVRKKTQSALLNGAQCGDLQFYLQLGQAKAAALEKEDLTVWQDKSVDLKQSLECQARVLHTEDRVLLDLKRSLECQGRALRDLKRGLSQEVTLEDDCQDSRAAAATLIATEKVTKIKAAVVEATTAQPRQFPGWAGTTDRGIDSWKAYLQEEQLQDTKNVEILEVTSEDDCQTARVAAETAIAAAVAKAMSVIDCQAAKAAATVAVAAAVAKATSAVTSHAEQIATSGNKAALNAMQSSCPGTSQGESQQRAAATEQQQRLRKRDKLKSGLRTIFGARVLRCFSGTA